MGFFSRLFGSKHQLHSNKPSTRIFLSSTYSDLVEHRQVVTNALEKLGQQVGRMEIFGALPTEPLEACVKEIDACDIFVGIYARRYGHIPAGSPYSITELEFRRAQEQEKPLFCFLLDEKFPWPQDSVEGGEGQIRLLAFKESLRESLVVDFFSEPLDLAVKVATAVGRYLIGNPKLLAFSPKDKTEQMQRQALVKLLEARKASVMAQFDSGGSRREQFLRLHELNIAAIRKGELLVSHLLTADIHTLIAQAVNARRAEGFQHNHDVQYSIENTSPSDCVDLYPYTEDDRSNRQFAFDMDYMYLRRGGEGNSSLRHYNSNSWRENLLSDWLSNEIQKLEYKLSRQREIHVLELKADERGLMQAYLRPGVALCPQCKRYFDTSLSVGERERCPECRTHVELTDHLIIHNVCKKCGSTADAIKHFGLKCS